MITIRKQIEAWGALLDGEVEGVHTATVFMNYDPFKGKIGESMSGRGKDETAALSNLLIKVREVAWNRCLFIEDLHRDK